MRERDEILACLAYWIPHYRQLRKLNQMELAVRVGVDLRQIGRIEQQVNAPSIILASRIADALDVSLDQLLQPLPPQDSHPPLQS